MPEDHGVGLPTRQGEPESPGTRDAGADASAHSLSGKESTMGTILLVIVVLMLLGALPTWPHSRAWGYGPSGGLTLVLVVLLLMVLTGRL
jgi:hypothetical protein